jgi:hypothetical protein
MGDTVVGSDSAVLNLLLEKVYRDGGHDFFCILFTFYSILVYDLYSVIIFK